MFGEINRTASCVRYLWSAAFLWQLGATGFNYHHDVKGPGCTPVCVKEDGGGMPMLPSCCLQRLRGSEQPLHQETKREEAQGHPLVGEKEDDAQLPKTAPQTQRCSTPGYNGRKETAEVP